MYFANPWGLLSLISLPIIAYIHIFHRRYPPMEIAGLHLWGVEVNRQSPGRKKEKLPLSRTLLLELLAALLLSLLVSQPRFGDPEKVPHLVAILDNSASMSAYASKDKVPFRDAAISTIKGRLKSMGKKAVLTVLLTGRRPEILAGPGINIKEAEPLLEKWKPTAGKHDFNAAWDLAYQHKSDASTLLFITDTPLDKATEKSLSSDLEVIALGEKLPNVAFTAGNWVIGKNKEPDLIYARVANLGPKETTVNLTVIADGQAKPIAGKSLKIPSRIEEVVQFPVTPGVKSVTLSLDSPDDPLAIDSTMQLVEPERKTLKIAISLPKEHPAVKHLTKVLKFIDNWELSDGKNADLAFAPATSIPAGRPESWWIGIGPLADNSLGKGQDYIGPYIMEKRNPLVDGLSLGGVVWGGARPIETNVLPVISVGAIPVYMQMRGAVNKAYLLNIDLNRSNITDSPDWPILVSNIVEECRRNQPGLRQWNYRQDQIITFTLPEEILSDNESELQLVYEDSIKPLAKTRFVELPPQVLPGIYSIRAGEKTVGTFSINFFDRNESELSGLDDAHRQISQAGTKHAYILDDPFTVWVLIGTIIVVGVIISDWFVLRPRNLVTSK